MGPVTADALLSTTELCANAGISNGAVAVHRLIRRGILRPVWDLQPGPGRHHRWTLRELVAARAVVAASPWLTDTSHRTAHAMLAAIARAARYSTRHGGRWLVVFDADTIYQQDSVTAAVGHKTPRLLIELDWSTP